MYNMYINNTVSSSSRPSQHLHPCLTYMNLHDRLGFCFCFVVAVGLYSEIKKVNF